MANFEEVKDGIIFPKGDKNEKLANYFTGQSFLERLVEDNEIPVGVSNVTFEPSSRNNWHIHRDGFQILLVTGGEGWYQEQGKPAQLLRTGESVIVHEGVKHWHGASKESWFVHLSISSGNIEWLEEVSDEYYNQFS